MKKIKGVILLGILLVTTFVVVSCGGTTNNPEDVATKFLENSFKKDIRDENIKKETLNLIHSNVQNKEESIKAAESLQITFDTLKKEFKAYEVDEKFDEFLEATLEGIKINKTKADIGEKTATVDFEIKIPSFNESNFQKEAIELLEEKLKNVKGKPDVDTLTKEVFSDVFNVIIADIKKGETVETENISVELEKDSSEWKIISTY